MVVYPKIRRLPVYETPYRKEVLSDAEIAELFSGTVVVEEKVDGKLMHKDLDGRVVFYEYTRVRHQILYERLPSYELAFDVYDKERGAFLGLEEKHSFLRELGMCHVPVLFTGEIRYESWRETVLSLMRRPSRYGPELIEGIVVKNYAEQLFAKAVNKEFDEALRESNHYLREIRRGRSGPSYNKLLTGGDWERRCYPGAAEFS